MSPPQDPREVFINRLRQIEKSKLKFSKEPDPKSEAEKKFYEKGEELEFERLSVEITGARQDIKERKRYASLYFALACTWVCVIRTLLLFEGFSFKTFRLSERVLLACIGSTTANILGVLYVVANYLFPKKMIR